MQTLEAVASDDARGTIREAEFEGGFAIQEILVKADNLPLGGHYHIRRTETFTILEGGGTLTTYPVDESGKPIGPPMAIGLRAPQTVFVDCFTVHTFRLDPGTRMRCYNTLPFSLDADMCAASEYPV